MKKLTILINGMHCGACTEAVREALSSLSGVEVEEVVVGRASVVFDPERAGNAAILAAVRKAGAFEIGGFSQPS